MFKGLILMTLISTINVTPIATYRPTLYDLDYPQAELNNYTLRQVFEEQVLPLPVDGDKYSVQLPDGTTFYGTDSGYYIQQIADDEYTPVNLILFALADKYSPMFDTTWDNLSDEQIDLQIRDYMAINYHNLNFDEIGELTDSQINYWYDHYQTLKWYEFNDIPVGNQININSDIVILLIGLTLFIVGYLLAWKTGHSWLYAISGLLWFIPIAILDNMWIIIFSIVMIIFSAILAFMKKE